MANNKYLVIELDKLNGVPRVYYKGEEIVGKVHVKFDWTTKTDKPAFGSPFIDIEYFVTGEEKPHTKSIRYNGFFQEGDNND